MKRLNHVKEFSTNVGALYPLVNKSFMRNKIQIFGLGDRKCCPCFNLLTLNIYTKVVVVNYCFTSFFGTNGHLSDIVIR